MSRKPSQATVWYEVESASSHGTHSLCHTSLLASNKSFVAPQGLDRFDDFVSYEEESILLEAINQEDFVREGFEQQRRVQRISFDDEKFPAIYQKIRGRIEERLGYTAGCLAIEEYCTEKVIYLGSNASHMTVATFESNSPCSGCNNDEGKCCCFIAQIPLRKPAVQHFNKPARRRFNCWNFKTENHHSDIHMEPRSLFLKTEDCLWNWRSRITASRESEDKVIVLKFYSLSDSTTAQPSTGVEMESFGYVASENDHPPIADDMPPMEDLLTIIVTTSPIKSNPSTEMVEKAMDTFRLAGEAFALKCRKLIVCDGVRNKDESVTQKYTNVKQNLRNGIVTQPQLENYEEYKHRLRHLCKNATEDSVFNNAQVEELKERNGYGFALRHALCHCVTTPYVCVVQHDRTFLRTTPMKEALEAMHRHPFIKYLGLSMRSNLLYRDVFLSKYGRTYLDEFKNMIVRVPELKVSADLYGPGSESTHSLQIRNEKVRTNITALEKTYQLSDHAVMEREWTRENPLEDGMHQMSLTPTLFWNDNIHICETKHYRDFIFDPQLKMVAKGGFVEDKLSPVLVRTVERLGLSEGHSRFGCYLLDDHSGMFFTGHLDGGCYMLDEDKKRLQGKS